MFNRNNNSISQYLSRARLQYTKFDCLCQILFTNLLELFKFNQLFNLFVWYSIARWSCNCDPLHQFSQTGIGCRQECERDYFIARSDNICVPDRRIKSNVSYFETPTFNAYTLFQFIHDYQNFRGTPLLIYSCSSTNYVGSLLYNEGMRISSSSVICSTHDLIRIEAILRTYSLTPRLLLKGSQLTQATSIWGFRNITIDNGNCKENCLVCADFSSCQQCQTGYILYQNGCVSSCPVHSINCVDYTDIIPYSRYLAKGFYNLNMSTSDINHFFDSTISTGNNFMIGQKFSIFPTQFVLGGIMVWSNAIYQKSWSICCYNQIQIRFNVTYGDGYSGVFYYKLQGVKSAAYSKPISGGYNFIGRTQSEITRYFEIFENPFQESILDIEFQCTGTSADPRDEFCAISDYFIVVHYVNVLIIFQVSPILSSLYQLGYMYQLGICIRIAPLLILNLQINKINITAI